MEVLLLKKLIIILGAVLLLGVSVYAVMNYNNSKNDANNSLDKSSEKEAPSTSNQETEKNNESTNEEKQENADSVAPSFTLQNLSGQKVSLEDFKGKKVFLNFWATWCPPCVAEMPDIQKLYEETKDKDIVFLGVNIGEGRETASTFTRKNGINFPILLDDTTAISLKYNVRSIPTTFIIDEKGNITSSYIGLMTEAQMREALGL